MKIKRDPMCDFVIPVKGAHYWETVFQEVDQIATTLLKQTQSIASSHGGKHIAGVQTQIGGQSMAVCMDRKMKKTDFLDVSADADGKTIRVHIAFALKATPAEKKQMHALLASVLVHEFAHQLQYAQDPKEFKKKTSSARIKNYLAQLPEPIRNSLKNQDLDYTTSPSEVEAQTFEFAYLQTKNTKQSYLRYLLQRQADTLAQCQVHSMAYMAAPLYKEQAMIAQKHNLKFPKFATPQDLA